MRIILVMGLLALVACSNKSESGKENFRTGVGADVIYGSDDRRDLYEVRTPAHLVLADSTVALMDKSKLSSAGLNRVKIDVENYGKANELCPTERFVDQDAAAFCSGFLVDANTVVTAGHCITGPSDCLNVRFVFGFGIRSRGDRVDEVASEDVFGCSKVVHTQAVSAGADYAVITLDRPVTHRKPLALRRSGSPQVGDKLVVIGHPSGLPTKVADNSSVRAIKTGFMVANLDTYGGNSGSAVFNAVSGEVEGILVRGETDFKRSGSCYVSYVCSESGCRGEDVTLISQVLPHLSSGPVEPPPEASVFESQPGVSIPDNSAAGVSDSVEASSAPGGRKVFVSVDISHTYRGDLKVSVIALNGQEVVVHNRVGGSQDNLVASFELSQLSGVIPAGRWTLKVVDLARVDVGVLKSWKLEFR